jgi:hypothetical protein
MTNKLERQATKGMEKVLGRRWCSFCQSRKETEGGRWINGKPRRWQCKQCTDRRKA